MMSMYKCAKQQRAEHHVIVLLRVSNIYFGVSQTPKSFKGENLAVYQYETGICHSAYMQLYDHR